MASFSTTGASNTLMPMTPVSGLLVFQPQSAAGFSCLRPHSKLADIHFTHTMVIAVFSSATPNTKEDYQTFCFSLNGRRHGVQHPGPLLLRGCLRVLQLPCHVLSLFSRVQLFAVFECGAKSL